MCCAVSPPRREPLGASSDPAGSESLPALLHHCITKAKGVAANNNNNTTSARRTGWCHWQVGGGGLVDFLFLFFKIRISQKTVSFSA